MTRLVILARKLDLGGAEAQLVVLAKGLKQRGRDVHVVLFYKGGRRDKYLNDAGVPIHYIDKKSRWDTIGFIARYIRTIKQLQPDIIYSFLDVPNIIAVLTSPLLGVTRVVWSIRAAYMNMNYYDWLVRVIPRVEAALSNMPDLVVANSMAGAQWGISRGFPSSSITVIENGIDTNAFDKKTQNRAAIRAEWGVCGDHILIGLVARLDPMKDHYNFLHACSIVKESHSNVRFICVGGGGDEYKEQLSRYTEMLGIESVTVWTGPRKDISDIYNALDILCSSSSSGEGFSNVIAEAMACGVPCVVTDVGDSARIVGNTGEVCRPQDAEALAHALLKMMARLNKESDLGMRCRHRIVSEFSLQRMLDRSDKVIFDSA